MNTLKWFQLTDISRCHFLVRCFISFDIKFNLLGNDIMLTIHFLMEIFFSFCPAIYQHGHPFLHIIPLRYNKLTKVENYSILGSIRSKIFLNSYLDIFLGPVCCNSWALIKSEEKMNKSNTFYSFIYHELTRRVNCRMKSEQQWFNLIKTRAWYKRSYNTTPENYNWQV